MTVKGFRPIFILTRNNEPFYKAAYQALESNMGARKDGAREGAMHSPLSEVGTFLVV